MIRFYRGAAIAPGKQASALGFAKEMSSYLKEKHGLVVEVSVPVGGNPNRVGWSTTYDGLGALESAMAKMMADPKYMEMVSKGSDNFLAGSVRDQIWRSV
jgi:hypothetical protein